MATKDFLHDLNLNLNQILNARLQVLASDPAGQLEGQFIYNSTEDRIKYWDGVQWRAVASLTDVAGLLDYKGGYDAAANTPNLDSSPTAGTILKGDTYTVTTPGTFYTIDVQPGDMLIAQIDNPATAADWTIVEQNLTPASETVAGYIRIATQAEANAGTDDTTAITPLKLDTILSALNFSNKFAADLVGGVFGGGQTTFTVAHNLGTTDVIVYTRTISTGQEVNFEVVTVDANSIQVKGNGNIPNSVYRVVVIG